MTQIRTVKGIRESRFVRRFVKAAGLPAAVILTVLAVISVGPPRGRAQSENENNFDPARVAQGLAIAPVHLSYQPEKRCGGLQRMPQRRCTSQLQLRRWR